MRLPALALVFLSLASCGHPAKDGETAPSPAPAPAPAPGPTPPAPPSWATVAPIVARDCGGCHNGAKLPAFTSGAVFKAGKAKAKLLDGTMPPSGVIAAADKAALLAYLGS